MKILLPSLLQRSRLLVHLLGPHSECSLLLDGPYTLTHIVNVVFSSLKKK